MMQDQVIITCALTGAGPMSGNPNHPVTPRQIADSGLAAAEAGAAILHVHVRDPRTREFSGDPALYEEAVGLIREQNADVITTVRLNEPRRADSQALARPSGRFGLVPI
jgi:uncharacterized protein (DUF849 family)